MQNWITVQSARGNLEKPLEKKNKFQNARENLEKLGNISERSFLRWKVIENCFHSAIFYLCCNMKPNEALLLCNTGKSSILTQY